MNKQEIKRHFRSGDVPTEAQFAEWIERCVVWIDDVSELPDACAPLSGTCYLVAGKAVVRCEQADGGWKWMPYGSIGGGTGSYLELTNKPRINGVTLSGQKHLRELGIMPDFDGLRGLVVLDDNVRLVIGIKSGNGTVEPFSTTLGALKAYLAASPVSGGSLTRIGFSGVQDGSNTEFGTEGKFVEGTSALYLNGQRMYPGEDYTELDGKGFKMAEPPVANDRMMFEAVPADDYNQL